MWLFLINLGVNKDIKFKKKFWGQPFSQYFEALDVLTNFIFNFKTSRGYSL